MKPALLTYPYIASYPVLMLLGFFAAWILVRQRAPLYKIEARHLDNIALLLPIAGLLGSRLFARLFYAKLPLFEALKFWQGGGLVFYGGFIFGIATVLTYGAVRRINIIAFCDCLAPGVAVGLAFGRIGCFLGGCCWGDLCASDATLAHLEVPVAHQVRTFRTISTASWPLAVHFPSGSDPYKQQVKLGLIENGADQSLPIHPVQLYETVLALALAFWLHRKFRGNQAPAGALAMLAGYAVIRFCTEYLRADNKLYAFGLTISQIISIEILLFCLTIGLVRLFVFRCKGDALSPLPERIAT